MSIIEVKAAKRLKNEFLELETEENYST